MLNWNVFVGKPFGGDAVSRCNMSLSFVIRPSFKPGQRRFYEEKHLVRSQGLTEFDKENNS